MPLSITPLPALRDNYIWIIHDEQHAIVVDPGVAQPVEDFLRQHRLSLAAILCTHWQKDHTGGICELAAAHAIPVYGPLNEDIACISQRVGEGANIEIPTLALTFQVMEIPGHTRGHIAFINELGLFCGDTLFGAGCGRVFDSTVERLHQSVQRLATLPDDTLIYCSHEYTEANLRFARACEPGNAKIEQRQHDTRTLREQGLPSLPSKLALEKATNPFLRCTQPEIVRNTEQQAGKPLPDPLAVFIALRQWRNIF
ncbi:MAG: hydroxyacylglutathione hydrolase [Nitrosomonadales bacterium]|nr:hydroxyacylglutathione hydrolase [Nitrosomonadales bacterium]